MSQIYSDSFRLRNNHIMLPLKSDYIVDTKDCFALMNKCNASDLQPILNNLIISKQQLGNNESIDDRITNSERYKAIIAFWITASILIALSTYLHFLPMEDTDIAYGPSLFGGMAALMILYSVYLIYKTFQYRKRNEWKSVFTKHQIIFKQMGLDLKLSENMENLEIIIINEEYQSPTPDQSLTPNA